MKEIILYHTPLSVYYGQAKEFLNEKNIPYKIETRETEDQIQQETGQNGDLVFVFREMNNNKQVLAQEIINGFDKERIIELLK